MDKIDKFLNKLPADIRLSIFYTLKLLKNGNLKDLDVKKLKGRKDVYRIRKGKIRLIYRIFEGEVYVLAIERRSDNTY